MGLWNPQGCSLGLCRAYATDDPLKKDTLIYVVKHASREAAAKSWDAFRKDPAW